MEEVRPYVLAALVLLAVIGIGWMVWRIRMRGWWDEDYEDLDPRRNHAAEVGMTSIL